MLFTGFFMPLCGAGILNSNDKHMGKALPPSQPRERSSHEERSEPGRIKSLVCVSC